MTETISISDLQQDDRNANKGTERGRAMVKRSLEKLGAGRSILIDKNGKVIAGNKTIEAAASVNIDDVVVIRTSGDKLVAVMREDLDLDDPTGAAREMAYADNKSGQVGLAFDADILAGDFEAGLELDDWFDDWEMEEFGIVDEPLDEADAEPQIDRADELREEWGVELGQMWRLPSQVDGQEHRLICGDCTETAIVERVMGGEEIELLFTSPPYSDVRDYRDGVDLSIAKLSMIFDYKKVSYFVINIGLLFRDHEVFDYWHEWISEAKKRGLKHLAWNVWDKMQSGSVASATNMFFIVHEWLFVFGEKSKKLNRTIPNDIEKYKARHGDNVFLTGHNTGKRQKDNSIKKSHSPAYSHHQIHSVISNPPELGSIRSSHPATMPIDLVSQYIEAITNENDILADPFCGSGTTIIAAENLSRQCRAIEVSPAYVAVALQRYQDAFGITPELVTQNGT